MKARVIEDADEVTYVVVCDPGDEAVAALAQFARAERLEASQITAVGAFERATVGWFDRAAKQYRRIPVGEQCEVLSLIGDVAEGQDGPSLHVHVVLGLSDGTTRGGHLLEGWVFPTLEVVLTETPAELRKVMRPDLGIAVIDLDRSLAEATGAGPAPRRRLALPSARAARVVVTTVTVQIFEQSTTCGSCPLMSARTHAARRAQAEENW